MAKGKPYRRLSLKLLAMLLLAAMAAVALGLTLRVLGDYLVQEVYCSEKRQAQRLQASISSFRAYVQEEGVSSTNVQKIGAWNREHPYIQLTVSANGAILNSDRWGAEMVGSDGGFVIRAGNAEVENAFPVNFTDGSYRVEIQDFSQNQLYAVVNWVAVATGGVVFLALMLLYNSRVTSSISRLARQVRQVSQGDLTLEITPSSQDEIGDLAEDVDAMRLSIMDKLQREETAWRANTELITAISHDVRTPLTTLMGYLDILGENDNLTPVQQQEYLSVCRQKAEKLRTLTNELFSDVYKRQFCGCGAVLAVYQPEKRGRVVPLLCLSRDRHCLCADYCGGGADPLSSAGLFLYFWRGQHCGGSVSYTHLTRPCPILISGRTTLNTRVELDQSG